MRELTTHQVNGLNANLRVIAEDAPGPGGANHRYLILRASDGLAVADFKFQNGPIAEAGVNGISNEALLAIVIDRLAAFQAGPFPCGENQYALRYLETGLEFLRRRTREREARQVEGTLQP